MKILIVDDSNAMRMIVLRTLRQAGFENHTFEEHVNGAEALKAVQSAPPDLILSDWNMPEMNGIQLLTELRKLGNQVKFGFITSEASAEMKKLATDSGALFLITKPFTVETFQQMLTPLMA